MANPIFAMLLSVGIGLAVGIYMYYQGQRVHEPHYDGPMGHGRPTNRGSTPNDRSGYSGTTDAGSPGRRPARRRQSQDPVTREHCTICLDEKSQESWRTLACHHRFHSKCISVWFNEKHSCPTCRSEFGSRLY